MSPRARVLSSLAGLLIGAVVLVLVTAFLSGVYSSVQANHTLGVVTDQLHSAQADRDDLTAQLDALSRSDALLHTQITKLEARNVRLSKQYRRATAQLAALVAFLHSQGIEVPATITSGGGGGTPRKRRHAAAAPPQGPGHSGSHPCAHSRKC